MTWVKIDDAAFDDPRFLDLERGVGLLHFEALGYSARHTTGGRISLAALGRLTTEPDPVAAAEALVTCGIWKKAKDGYQVVWLLDDQLSTEEVERYRVHSRERQAKRRRHVAGDHSLCDPRYCRQADRNVTRDSHATSRVSHATPTHPVPTARKDRDGARGTASGSPTAARAGHGEISPEEHARRSAAVKAVWEVRRAREQQQAEAAEAERAAAAARREAREQQQRTVNDPTPREHTRRIR